jgi:hypothetical protein
VPVENLAGKIGPVTGVVRPGHVGEVMLRVGDRVEAYYAVPYDGEEIIDRGGKCIVVESHPQLSRTVYVTAMPGGEPIEGASA